MTLAEVADAIFPQRSDQPGWCRFGWNGYIGIPAASPTFREMEIDGRPALACRTLTKNLGAEFTLAPLPVFELIGDLSVNTGKWMRGMSERLQTWVHEQEEALDLTRLEARMEPELAEKIYELDRCIECGCCVAACGTARMREDFVGAVGLNKIARFRLDPRDTRSDDDFYELIGDDDGVFGCMSLLGCHDVCPKQLPLATQIAFVRRKMVAAPLARYVTPFSASGMSAMMMRALKMIADRIALRGVARPMTFSA